MVAQVHLPIGSIRDYTTEIRVHELLVIYGIERSTRRSIALGHLKNAI
jgi:hypothetical protein